jgi:DNA-binding CsgD family transcriptional regulator
MAKPDTPFKKMPARMQFLKEVKLSQQRRSLIFFLCLMIAVISGLSLIIFSAGVFAVERNKLHVFLQNELGHVVRSVEQEYGVLSVEGILLAEKLSKQIELSLDAFGLCPADLKSNPQYLEPILSQTMGALRAALEKNKSSGVFLILDATVNPALNTAENSRAGLFLKNMEPNVINVTFPTIRLLRGPATIARQEDLDLLPQWQLEFSIEPDDFFFTTIGGATGSDLPLSRLYYWNPASLMVGSYNKAMLLCAPLVATDGTIMGICGFEVNAMLFKLQYTPANSPYTRAFTMLAPLTDNTLDASGALYAGHFAAAPFGDDDLLAFRNPVESIASYKPQEGIRYCGLHQTINLYPKGSVFSDQQWALGILIPKWDLAASFIRQNRAILLLLLVLLIFGVVSAVLLRRKHAVLLKSPLAPGALSASGTSSADASDALGTSGESGQSNASGAEVSGASGTSASGVGVPDVSGAFDISAIQPEETGPISPLVQNFIENVATLSPAERSVFDLYLQGYTAREISEKLCISINTVKTHNKRIYNKLNVGSLKELLLYVKLIRASNDETAEATITIAGRDKESH